MLSGSDGRGRYPRNRRHRHVRRPPARHHGERVRFAVDDPADDLVSLDCGSDLLAVVRQARRFGVNILGSTQSALALAFARKGPEKFRNIAWEADHGLPRLPGAPGWLACEVTSLVDGGDHIVALGAVVAAATDHGEPLTYHGRAFGTHTALDEASR